MASSVDNLAISGQCRKMPAVIDTQGNAIYTISLGEQKAILNEWVNSSIKIEFESKIQCIHCGRVTKKSFSQGYCFPCMKSLAQCDLCIMSPERCHYDAGTCREPDWADTFCMTDHIVYLANTTAAKVGITRAEQVPTRWIDQGAEQALPIYRVATRQQAGFIEEVLKQKVADKTNWRSMLKSDAEPIDLPSLRDTLFEECAQSLSVVENRFGHGNFNRLPEADVVDIRYPVKQYPAKITSLNLDKTPVIECVLQGIKGQYLILDTGVINLRKFTGYQLNVSFN